MGQLFEAVNYLHVEETVMHKDLKLSNVFLSKDLEVKIGDFGLAERVKGEQNLFVGTPGYMAPEIIMLNYQGS